MLLVLAVVASNGTAQNRTEQTMTQTIALARTLYNIVTDFETAQHSIETDRDCRNAALFGSCLFGAACGLLIAAVVTL